MPFLIIIFLLPQAMMEAVRLKDWRIRAKGTFQLPLPIGYPIFQRVTFVSYRTKKVQVIRHNQIIAHEPGLG
jgi:hypothetical protein